MTSSVQRAYSRVAEQYTDLFGSVERVHPGDLELIRRHLAQLSGPVLDLGCGPGHLSGFLHSLDADVTGIDLVPEFIAHARSTHPGVRFEMGSMVGLERPPGSVAGVLAWFSLIHLDPRQVAGVLATIRRVMAPGGALVLGFSTGPRWRRSSTRCSRPTDGRWTSWHVDSPWRGSSRSNGCTAHGRASSGPTPPSLRELLRHRHRLAHQPGPRPAERPDGP